jgi:hypothetical protein
VRDNGLCLLLAQRNETAHELQAPHREIHGNDLGIDLVGDAALFELPLVAS